MCGVQLTPALPSIYYSPQMQMYNSQKKPQMCTSAQYLKALTTPFPLFCARQIAKERRPLGGWVEWSNVRWRDGIVLYLFLAYFV